MKGLSLNTQSDLLDDTQDDLERDILLKLRQKRLRELQKNAAREKFGAVREIGSNQYIKEVTEASKGLWVVIHLYADSIPECKILNDKMVKLAYKKLHTKFVRIKGCLAIRNYPEKNCPTTLIYKDGEMKSNWVGLSKFGGSSMTVESLEWALAKMGAVKTDMTHPPSSNSEFKLSFKRRKVYSDSEDDYGDDEY